MIRKFKSNAARKKTLNINVNDDSFAHFSKIIIFFVIKMSFLLQQLYDKTFKSNQLQTVKKLIVNENIIFIVKIDYDKNMIFHFVSTLCSKFIVFIIMFLNVLQMNQIDDIKKLTMKKYNMKSCVFNSNIMTNILLKHIREKKYTHVFIDSKIVLKNSKFRSVLQHNDFQRKLKLLIIDEAHVIVFWNDEFRFAYDRFEKLRNFFFQICFDLLYRRLWIHLFSKRWWNFWNSMTNLFLLKRSLIEKMFLSTCKKFKKFLCFSKIFDF